MADTNLQMLEQTSEVTNLTMDMLLTDLNQLLWNEKVVSYLVAPREENTAREHEIIKLLKSSQQENKLSEAIWLYSYQSGQVFSSKEFSCSLEEFSDREILENHVPSKTASFPSESRNQAELVFENSRLFWIQDMVLSEPVGCLVLEIDLGELYRTLGWLEETVPSYIWDPDSDEWIVPSSLVGETAAIQNLSEENLLYTRDCKQYDKEEWYCVANETLGWSFLRKLNRADFTLLWSAFLPLMVPGIVLFVLIGLAGAYLVTTRIYAPINHLVHLVLKQREESEKVPENQNELAYLELSFFQAIDEKNNLQTTMDRFEQDILEQVFRKLLQGRSAEEAGMSALEEAWKEPWTHGSRYQVLACKRETDVENIGSVMNAQLFQLSLSQVVENTSVPASWLVVPMESDVVAIVLCLKDGSALQLKNIVEELEQKIRKAFLPSAYNVQVEHGRVYLSLEDIVYSWQEGIERIKYAVYREKSALPVDEEDILLDRYYQERAHQIVNHIRGGKTEEAQELLSRVIQELIQSEELLEEKKKQVVNIQEIFLENQISVVGEVWEQAGMDLMDLAHVSSEKELMEEITPVLKEQLNEIQKKLQKKSYHYVESALGYMKENYNDSSLSSMDVAEYLHIHANYFSNIFNEHMKESFSSSLNRIRVERARELLSATQIPIKDVGFKCGFTTVQHFNRMFKKYTGMTPSQYRKSPKSE
ncbi:MAG: AraC family transcriptional regulator [Clostridiales bacterium]|nr:AraC family transcriptional regulator [Clostridiales bacterium]